MSVGQKQASKADRLSRLRHDPSELHLFNDNTPRPEGGRPGGGRYTDPKAKERLTHSNQSAHTDNGQSLPPDQDVQTTQRLTR
jgi:hypothetical protein